MELHLEEFENQRKMRAKPARIFKIVGIVSFILAIVFFFVVGTILKDGEENWPYILGVICFTLALIGLIVTSTAQAKWKNEFAKQIMPEILKDLYGGGSYSPKGRIDKKTFNKPKFFGHYDTYKADNLLEAKYGNVAFKMEDYKLTETHSNGKQTTTTVVGQGRFFVFDFERDFEHSVKILEKSFGSYGKGFGQNAIQLENVAFNKKFLTLCDDELTAFYILTPQFQEKLMELESSFKGQIYFLFEEHYLYVAVNDSNTSFKISLFKPLDNEHLQSILRDIALPKAFIDALKLNRDKYSRDTTTSI